MHRRPRWQHPQIPEKSPATERSTNCKHENWPRNIFRMVQSKTCLPSLCEAWRSKLSQRTARLPYLRVLGLCLASGGSRQTCLHAHVGCLGKRWGGDCCVYCTAYSSWKFLFQNPAAKLDLEETETSETSVSLGTSCTDESSPFDGTMRLDRHSIPFFQ